MNLHGPRADAVGHEPQQVRVDHPVRVETRNHDGSAFHAGSTLAFGCPLLVPAGVACTGSARPATAAVPFNTARRLDMPGSPSHDTLRSARYGLQPKQPEPPKQAVNRTLRRRWIGRCHWPRLPWPSRASESVHRRSGAGVSCLTNATGRVTKDQEDACIASATCGRDPAHHERLADHRSNAPFNFTAGRAPGCCLTCRPRSLPTP